MNLSRKIGLVSATSIVVANMIGAGIFTTSGLILANTHDPILLLILWFIGGIIALCGALSYGELGAAMPEAGGEYLFLAKLYHPLIGFLSGWTSLLVGFSAPIAASAIGSSEYLIQAFPNTGHRLFEATGVSAAFWMKTLAIVIIMSFTILHAKGVKSGTKVQNILTGLKVLIITVMIVAAFLSGKGDTSHFWVGTPQNTSSIWYTFGLSLMWILFAYSGWNASTYIGSEIKQPGKNLPRSLVAGTTLVIILYLLLNIVFVYAIPPDKMKGVIAVGSLAMGNLFGSSIEKLFSLMIALALFSSLSAFIIIGPRVYYAMARDHLFFKSIAKVHPSHHVPSKAIIAQGILAIIYVLTGSFEQILTYMGFSLSIFPILAVFGIFILRKKVNQHQKMPGYPFVPIIFILASVSILILAFLNRPLESSLAIAILILGIPVYYFFYRREHPKNIKV